jgi:hypothetical protein
MYETDFLWRNNPPRAQTASILRFIDHTQLGTHPVRLLCTTDQTVSEAATYTTNTNHEHPCSLLVEPAIPKIQLPQSTSYSVLSLRSARFDLMSILLEAWAAESLEYLNEVSTGSLCFHITICVLHLSCGKCYSRQSFAVSLGIDGWW